MSLTVADIRSIVAEVRSNPELRDELRRALVGDDLAAINESIRRLSEGQEAMQASLQLLTERMNALTVSVQTISGRLGNLEGEMYEFRWERHLGARLGKRFRNVREISLGNFAPADQALADGRISEADWQEIIRLDATALVKERGDPASPDILAAIELSRVIDISDVARASRRARLLAATGLITRAVVGGESILREAEGLAEQEGVVVILTAGQASAA